MRTAPRRHLSYASFVLLLAADVVFLSVLVLNQLFVIGQGWVWLIAMGVATAMTPMLLTLADRLFALARAARNIPFTGETFP